jgi:hypothetical protein
MNTFKRLGASVMLLLILILGGCTASPIYDGYGNFVGYQPTVDVPRVVNGATVAAIGAVACAPFRASGLCAAVGGAIGASQPVPQQIVVPFIQRPIVRDFGYNSYYGPQFTPPSCQEKYDGAVERTNSSYQNKLDALQAYLQSTGEREEYDSMTQEATVQHAQALENAKISYAQCVRFMR